MPEPRDFAETVDWVMSAPMPRFSLEDLPPAIREHFGKVIQPDDSHAFSESDGRRREFTFRHISQLPLPLMETYLEHHGQHQFEDFESGARPYLVPAIFKSEFFDGAMFHEFSTTVKVKSGSLTFRGEWFERSETDDIVHWLHEILPDSTYDTVTVWTHDVTEAKVIGLFQNLYAIQGLTYLYMIGSCTQSMVSAIRCDSLQVLTLLHPSFIPAIGHNPTRPNLKFIRCLLPSRPRRIVNPEEFLHYTYRERWDRLQQMRTESVNFTFFQRITKYTEPVLLAFVFFYGEETGQDADPLATWLLESLFAWEGPFDVDLTLERFMPVHRDRIIGLLNSILPGILLTKFIPPALAMRLHVRRWDPLTLAESLPDCLYELYISSPDHIDPEFIPKVIRHQKALRHLNIALFMDRSGTRFLPTASCTYHKPFPLLPIGLSDELPDPDGWVFVWSLQMRRYGDYWYVGRKYRESMNETEYRRNPHANMLPELVEEVRGWFDMNPYFEQINIKFCIGAGIRECFDRRMYNKDTGFIEFEELDASSGEN